MLKMDNFTFMIRNVACFYSFNCFNVRGRTLFQAIEFRTAVQEVNFNFELKAEINILWEGQFSMTTDKSQTRIYWFTKFTKKCFQHFLLKPHCSRGGLALSIIIEQVKKNNEVLLRKKGLMTKTAIKLDEHDFSEIFVISQDIHQNSITQRKSKEKCTTTKCIDPKKISSRFPFPKVIANRHSSIPVCLWLI